MLKKFIGDLVSILLVEGLAVDASLSYEEFSVKIFDQVKNLRIKEVASLKVLWNIHLVESSTWEANADMMS